MSPPRNQIDTTIEAQPSDIASGCDELPDDERDPRDERERRDHDPGQEDEPQRIARERSDGVDEERDQPAAACRSSPSRRSPFSTGARHLPEADQA